MQFQIRQLFCIPLLPLHHISSTKSTYDFLFCMQKKTFLTYEWSKYSNQFFIVTYSKWIAQELQWPQKTQQTCSELNYLNSLISSKKKLTELDIFINPGTSTHDLFWSLLVFQMKRHYILYQLLAFFLLEVVEDRDVTFDQIQESIVKCPLPMNRQIPFILFILSSKTL